MDVKRREPIAVVEYVLRKLERQAIDIGSHPVLIHEGLEALDRLREENARLRQRVAELEIAESAMNNLAAKLTATEAKLARCVEVAKSSPLVSYTPVDGEAIRVVPVSVVLAASSVVVPGVLDGDIAPAIRQITRERDEARAENERLSKLCCVCEGDCCRLAKERLEDNANLKDELIDRNGHVLRLTRERDEAREKLASLEMDYAEAQDIAVSESAGRRAAEAKLAQVMVSLEFIASQNVTGRYEAFANYAQDSARRALAAAKEE